LSWSDIVPVKGYSSTGTDLYSFSDNIFRVGQSFSSLGGVLTKARFKIAKSGLPTGNVFAVLHAHTGVLGSTSIGAGAALATSDAVDITTLSTSIAEVEFTFTGANLYTMVSGTNYVIALLYADSAGINILKAQYNATGTDVGNLTYSQALPSTHWHYETAYDLHFEVVYSKYNDVSLPTSVWSNI
jgi:hypothetical protein